MPFETRWYLPDRIIYIKATGRINDDEIAPLNQKVQDMLNQSPAQKVHLVYDATEQVAPPSLRAMRRFNVARHRKFGWGIQAGSRNPAINFMSQFVAQFAGIRMRFLSNVDDGLNFLYEVDDSLPPRP